MPSLSKELRNQLSRVTLDARGTAEAACRAALENLAVHEKDYRPHMTVEQRQLRNRLRARGRALGDRLDGTKGTQEIKHLAEDAAYEHWHRLLFTRFLTENNLLHTDEEQGNVPVTLEDCEELAPELGAKDGFDLACRFASRTLPGVFRVDDPIFELNLAQKDQVELRHLLNTLPKDVFTASDSLGWTYQFWQAKRKDEVNKSGSKIGADELSPVTQLFTEDYMVDFLLDNTLGAWWAGKKFGRDGSPQPSVFSTEAEARAAVALPGCEWKYLRFIKSSPSGEAADSSSNIQNSTSKISWAPAAGTFDGWPKSAKDLKCLDPCMGSGHFVVAMFERLVALCMAEEGLSEKDAVAAVIRDNLFGLEIDPRCTQIAAFNLALAAWRRVGYCELPAMNLACSGLAPNIPEKDWVAMAGEDDKLKRGMERLYRLFQNAPILGSLINPRAGEGDLVEAGFHELQPLLEKALAQETSNPQSAIRNPHSTEMAVTARGLAKAAEILAGQFTLVATNVPYLGRGKQDEVLMEYCERAHPEAKADLATCFVERCLEFCAEGSSTALVTPQNWLFLGGYMKLRQRLLKDSRWDGVARLGEHAFDSTQAGGAFVALVSLSSTASNRDHAFPGFDASAGRVPDEKAVTLCSQLPMLTIQQAQLKNPDARIVIGEALAETSPLGDYCECYQGIVTGDQSRFCRGFWEIIGHGKAWMPLRASYENGSPYSGVEQVLLWEGGKGQLHEYAALTRDQLHDMHESGNRAWGRNGVAVNRMRNLRTTLYFGEHFENCLAVIVPKTPKVLPAVWAFCSDASFEKSVRALDQKVSLTNATLVKIPFDLARWQKVAAEKYPHGLPKPFSSDPTQWLFNGHPAGANHPLHVAVARLLGYQWPRQTGSSFPDCPALCPDGLEKLSDEDGIVCLPAINREQPAAARLRALLAESLGTFDERQLLAACDSKSKTLDDWLRDEFFEQHNVLFHHRPFLWHIWDGRKDGFAAIINYHRLDNATLQKLTYTTLGNWIQDQEVDAKADKPGAADRLLAAQSLQAELIKILEGEAPYDIFIRWKPLNKQAIGWHPDLNDGVRLNIRPFLTANDVGKKGAGLLRTKPNIKWDKDRGKEPVRPQADYPWFWCETEPTTDPEGGKEFQGHRWNNVHLTLAKKKAAQST